MTPSHTPDAGPDLDLPGLSYRVRVEHYGLRYAPEGTTAHRDDDGEIISVSFAYERVTGDSLEHALSKVDSHHRERYGHLGGEWSVGLLGYRLDGVPIAQPLVLLHFERYGDGGCEWEVGEVGPDAVPGHTTRYRTDSRGQGLWRWARGDQQWVQDLGHLQWSHSPDGLSAVRLMHRWGLTDRREQHTAQQGDDDLITADEVLEVLREHGRPIGLATLRNYTSTPPPAWPGIARRVGRTPLWSRAAIRSYAAEGAAAK